MNIFVLTVKRPGGTNYLKRLIESLRPSWEGTIHIMMGGSDYSDLEGIPSHNIEIHYVSEEGLADNIQKAAQGYYEALTFDRNTPALIFEDDGGLVYGWYDKIKELITFIPEEKFILSLIIPYAGSVPQPSIDILSVQRFAYQAKLEYKEPGELPITTIPTYCNTTGIYFPVSMLQTRLPEFIQRFAAHDQTVHDLALGHFMFRYNLPVYITVPPLLLDVDSADSSLGAIKRRMHVDYSDWDYKRP